MAETTTKGRKPAAVDLNVVEALAAVGCTVDEIAAELRLSGRTLQRREKEQRFHEAIERGRARGRASLRRAQWKAAQDGNVTAQIWLGKQMLGQRSFEKHEPGAAEAPPPLIINTFPDADQSHPPAEQSLQQPGPLPRPGSG